MLQLTKVPFPRSDLFCESGFLYAWYLSLWTERKEERRDEFYH